MDTDPRLFYAVSRDAGHTWSDQTQVGGSTSHSPALAVFNGRLYLAWKGGGDDQRLFYTSTPDGLVACHEIPSNFKSFRTPGKYT